MNIKADDGEGGEARATVEVEVFFKNEYTPTFTECDSYKPKILEEEDIGTFVFEVSLYYKNSS